MKSGITKIPRNIETLIANAVAGSGTPYKVIFKGFQKIHNTEKSHY